MRVGLTSTPSRPSSQRTQAEIDRYHVELRLMLSLNHPNILTLCGARASPPEYYLLFPYQENGSVSRLVHEQRWAPTWGAALILLREIAAALAYVHARGIVHRDIKPANVLIGADWVARLADFGLAEDETALRESLQASIYQTEDAEGKAVAGRYVGTCRQGTAAAPSGGFQKQHMVGTLAYMAPEVLMRRVPSFPADVYAFAIVTAEVCTGTAPYADRARNVALAHTVLDLSYNEADLAKAIASEGLRPSLPGEAGAAYFGASAEDGDDPLAWAPSAEKLRAAVERGWSADPNARPTFIDVQKDLDAIAESYRASGGRLARVWRPPIGRVGQPRAFDDLASTHSWPRAAPERAGTYPARFPPMTNKARVCNAGVFSTCGARGADKMEDRHVVCNGVEGIEGAHLIGVFDGHRGAECADFAARNIAAALTSTWHAHDDPGEALREAFTSVDAAFVDAFERSRSSESAGDESRKESSPGSRPGVGGARFPGCTACVALVLGDVAYVANAGDCRAVMCVDYDSDAHVALTRDHAADTNEDERLRIENAGGSLRLVPNGGGGDTWRVGAAGLAVTRALGDADCKRDGVTAMPEVTKVDLTPAHEYLVVACDGLWDVVSDEECVKMIKDTVKEPNMCAKRLGSEALTRMSGDNITVIVAFLKDLATSEKVTWERAFTTNAI